MTLLIITAVQFALLIVLAITIYRDYCGYRINYGRNYLSPDAQLVILVWLAMSLISNFFYPIHMLTKH